MYFHILHETLYRYDVSVTLGQHWVRLTPQAPSRALRAHVQVLPAPVVTDVCVDGFGNEVKRLEFCGQARCLYVSSDVEVETSPAFVLDASAPLLQWGIPSADLSPFLQQPQGTHPSVQALADEVAREAGGRLAPFADLLCRRLFDRLGRHVRPVGPARPGHETLAVGSGACRDLTVLFLEACRAQGLPARFASGYQAAADTPDGQRHLHAWPEVFVREVGWQGWDPMHGVRVSEGHVRLCAAPAQEPTMPLEGGFSFVGSQVTSTLDHSVCISTSGPLRRGPALLASALP